MGHEASSLTDCPEPLACILDVEQLLAQVWLHLVEYRCPHSELAQRRRQSVDHFVCQVGKHRFAIQLVVNVHAKSSWPQGARREEHSRHPSTTQLLQISEILGVGFYAEACEELGELFSRELQIGEVDIRETVLHQQGRDEQRGGYFAALKHQTQVVRHAGEESIEHDPRATVLAQLGDAREDQRHRPADMLADVVGECIGSQAHFRRRKRIPMNARQQRLHVPLAAGQLRAECAHHAIQERGGVVVVGVQVIPHHRHVSM